MEQTTLQTRIEERAAKRLLKDMLACYRKQCDIQSFVGKELFPTAFTVDEVYDSYNHTTQIRCIGTAAQQIFDNLLPKYVADVTDEILSEIDQIKYLVANSDLVEA
jgi:hypothetical protein